MKQKYKSNRKHNYPLLGLLIIVLAGALLFILYQRYGEPRVNDINKNGAGIQVDGERPETKKELPGTDNKTSEDIDTSTTGTIEIASFNQSDGYVTVEAKIKDFAAQQCVYTFSIEAGKPVVREQSGSCSKISIPEGEFDRIGVYTLTVTAYADSDKLTTSQEIDIQ